MLPSRKPIDRYHSVYLIILLNGFGIVITWNMWITIAPTYYVEYKLIEVDRNNTQHLSSSYATNFLIYLILASNLPCFILNLINLFFTFNGSLEKRINFSLTVIALICLITLVFTVIDTSSMVTIFFIITITTIVIQNAACGLYQNSLFGLVAIFPPRYTSAILLGSNICGIFVSTVNIITLVATNNIQTAAFFYFFISLLAVLACLGSLFMLVKLDFYQHYMQNAAEKMANKNLNEIFEFKRNNSTNEIGLKIDNCEFNKRTNISNCDNIDLLTVNFRMKLYLYYDIFKKVTLLC
ncbi:hypothetical protein LOAG_13152 [Loa loa]|uniref:Uncharacterized protein n=1 Tax=Loa loa TaxID=7209 RepID=A0A1S0TKE6_LOALO|nr:hypothetical protein LOAG_13152 [Loa loa]EFO15358.2 hypothetical protein LOAG_13152 [Loa loa]